MASVDADREQALDFLRQVLQTTGKLVQINTHLVQQGEMMIKAQNQLGQQLAILNHQLADTRRAIESAAHVMETVASSPINGSMQSAIEGFLTGQGPHPNHPLLDDDDWISGGGY